MTRAWPVSVSLSMLCSLRVLESALIRKYPFTAALLDRPLPQSDPQSSRHLQQQCQLLLARLTAGGSFRQILDEVRYGLAREYLVNSDLPMDEISRLLGYSESGNFSHACRRWTGLSPIKWRQHHNAYP